MTRSFWPAAVLALLAGLVLLAAGGADWVTGVEARDVGSGIVLREQTGSAGTRFAPLAVAFGLGGMVGGIALAVTRSGLRRTIGAMVAAGGAGGLAVVVAGTLTAAAAEGGLTPAPFFAMAGAVGVTVAGVAALRSVHAPPAASRYRVADERLPDDEWALAAGDEEEPTT